MNRRTTPNSALAAGLTSHAGGDDISKDTFGIDSARKLDTRVAEAALGQ